MTEKEIKELAEVYGIVITEAVSGQGGLFYDGFEGKKIEADDLFASECCEMPQRESISLKNCSTYSTYTEGMALMLNAAA